MKTTINRAEFETFQPFVFFFALACERIVIKAHNIEIERVTGPENVLFEGTFLHLSAGNLTGWGSEGVKASLEGRETRAVTESDRTGRQIVACAAD